MREILFRGKKRDNGEWAYGDLCQVLPGCECKFNLIFSQDECATSSIVLPETVGQSTGMIDKNGRKIFEGDIVKVSHGGSTYYAKIEWDSGSFWVTNHDIQMPNYISEVSRTYLEIIGNLHDNSELLEVTE